MATELLLKTMGQNKIETNKKTLTIFTPTYNRAYTLHLGYEALLRQTCKDFVWLIVDDGSTDDTLEWVEKWIAERKIDIRYLWGIERSGFFNGREKWAKGFENQRV